MSLDDESMIIIDYSREMLQIVALHTDDPKGIIHNHNMFIVQATSNHF